MQGTTQGTGALALGVIGLNLQPLAWTVLVLVTLEGLATIALGIAPRFFMNLVFSVLALHVALRTLETGGRLTGLDAATTTTGAFPWLFLFRTVVLALPGLLAMLMVAGLIMPGFGDEPALFAGVIAGILTNTAVFALFGSMLVEIAAGREGDPEEALDRGRAHFGPTFTLMLMGPAAGEFILFLVETLARSMGVETRIASPDAAHLNP
ncbi:MAG: hypothetical protein AAFR52_09105, partial [Pseudomonadota bacterium]